MKWGNANDSTCGAVLRTQLHMLTEGLISLPGSLWSESTADTVAGAHHRLGTAQFIAEVTVLFIIHRRFRCHHRPVSSLPLQSADQSLWWRRWRDRWKPGLPAFPVSFPLHHHTMVSSLPGSLPFEHSLNSFLFLTIFPKLWLLSVQVCPYIFVTVLFLCITMATWSSVYFLT